MRCFELVRQDGNVAIIKLDGEREDNFYTVFISFPNSENEMIRFDGGNLQDAMRNVLSKYCEQNA